MQPPGPVSRQSPPARNVQLLGSHEDLVRQILQEVDELESGGMCASGAPNVQLSQLLVQLVNARLVVLSDHSATGLYPSLEQVRELEASLSRARALDPVALCGDVATLASDTCERRVRFLRSAAAVARLDPADRRDGRVQRYETLTSLSAALARSQGLANRTLNSAELTSIADEIAECLVRQLLHGPSLTERQRSELEAAVERQLRNSRLMMERDSLGQSPYGRAVARVQLIQHALAVRTTAARRCTSLPATDRDRPRREFHVAEACRLVFQFMRALEALPPRERYEEGLVGEDLMQRAAVQAAELRPLDAAEICILSWRINGGSEPTIQEPSMQRAVRQTPIRMPSLPRVDDRHFSRDVAREVIQIIATRGVVGSHDREIALRTLRELLQHMNQELPGLGHGKRSRSVEAEGHSRRS